MTTLDDLFDYTFGEISATRMPGEPRRAYTAENFDESLVRREHGRFARHDAGPADDVDGPVRDTGERTGLWHLTDDPHFRPDPTEKPAWNSLAGDLMGDARPEGLFVGDPEYWMHAYQYERPYVAEIVGDVTDPPGTVMHEGREHFVQGDMHTARVLTIDEYAREHYGEPGWVEEYFDSGPSAGPGSLRDRLDLTDYKARDVSQMTPEEIADYERRFDEYAHRPGGPLAREGAVSRFARRAYAFDESAHPRGEHGMFTVKGGDDGGNAPASEYGLHYDASYVNDPDLAAAKKWDGWDQVPVTQVDPKTLVAVEDSLSRRSIDKVVSGREPLREGYVVRVVRKDDGTEIIVDGHHRAAMASAMDRPLDVKVADAATIRGTRQAYTAENFDESLVVREHGRFAHKEGGGEEPPLPVAPGSRDAAAGVELASIATARDWGPARREGDDEWRRWGFTPTNERVAASEAKHEALSALEERGYERESMDLTMSLWSGGAPDIVREQIDAPEPSNLRMLPVWQGANDIHAIASATEIGADVHRAVLMSDEQVAQLAPGVAFNSSTLESWSRDPEVAKDFGIPGFGLKPLDGNEGSTQVLMRLSNGRGMDIAPLGMDSYAWQDEVIVAADAYRIDKVTPSDEAPYPRIYLDVTAIPHPADQAAVMNPDELGRALTGPSFAEMSIALGHPPDEAVQASVSRFARRAYTFDPDAHPRGEGGRFTTKAIEDLVTDAINMEPPTEEEGRGPTAMIQMNAAIAEDVMRRNDIDAVMGVPMTAQRAESMVDALMEKYVPGLDYQFKSGDDLVDQYAGPETAAFTTRGMTELLPDDHPLHGADVALVYFRNYPRPVEVIHEIAHVVEGSWRDPPDDGHSLQWYKTYYEMLGDEGYDQAQNVLRAVMWDPTLEDTAA